MSLNFRAAIDSRSSSFATTVLVAASDANWNRAVWLEVAPMVQSSALLVCTNCEGKDPRGPF